MIAGIDRLDMHNAAVAAYTTAEVHSLEPTAKV